MTVFVSSDFEEISSSFIMKLDEKCFSFFHFKRRSSKRLLILDILLFQFPLSFLHLDALERCRGILMH